VVSPNSRVVPKTRHWRKWVFGEATDIASYQAEVSLRVNRLEPDLFRAFMSV
jgi:hypothetical protein